MNYKITLIGTKDTTLHLAEYLCHEFQKPDCIITIDQNNVDINKISGFSAINQYAEKNNIPCFTAKEYSLMDDESQNFFLQHTFELGICIGWQRLIPKYVLEQFKCGIYGFHGSCGYLPYGRGRSPLNWSIINGDTRFILNLFQYDEYADSPNVYKNRMFEINPYDTIRTLQYKNLMVSYELTKSLIMDYQNGQIEISKKSKDYDTLYSKREPKDGKVNFLMKTKEIYNLIRGVTRPFPGAFCFVDKLEGCVRIWDSVPFDGILNFSNYKPGEVIEVFDDMPIIRTVDGSILIREYEAEQTLKKGDILR